MQDFDNSRPELWVPFKKEMCDTCWASCCHDMPVEASVPDLIRMGYLTADEAASDLESAAERLQEQGVIREYSLREFVFILSQRPDGDCTFLDVKSRRCTIYAKRPEICRQFPKIGPKPGHCPYRKQAPGGV